MGQKPDYMRQNPIEAGFVANLEDDLYHSAMDYAGGKGMILSLLIE